MRREKKIVGEILSMLKELRFRELLLAPTENNLLQFFRYCFVGGIATVVDWLAIFLLTEKLGIYHLVSSVGSFAAGLVTNFILSKLLVFQKSDAKYSPRGEFVGYALIGVIGLGITEFILLLFSDCLNLYFMFSKAIATIVVLLWNYLARKKLIYR